MTNEKKILSNAGSVSHESMEEKVRLELAKYNRTKELTDKKDSKKNT